MPILENARHERFAQLVASGKHSDTEAFRLVGYSETGKGNAARLRDNESIAVGIEELHAQNAEKCQLSRDEGVQYLVEILKTPISGHSEMQPTPNPLQYTAHAKNCGRRGRAGCG
jgi:hypothetical protein